MIGHPDGPDRLFGRLFRHGVWWFALSAIINAVRRDDSATLEQLTEPPTADAGPLKKLPADAAIVRCLSQRHGDMLGEFEKIAESASLEP